MAVAFDITDEKNGQTSNGVASFTTAKSVSASATTLISHWVVGANVASLGTVTGKWNGVTMTPISSGTDIPATTGSVWMFGLKSPASGSHLVEVDWTGGGNLQWYLGFNTYTGGDTSGTGWNGATATHDGGSAETTMSDTFTTTSGDMVMIGIGNTGGGIVVNNSATLDWDDEVLTLNSGGEHKAAAGASTVSGFNFNSSRWAAIGVNVIQPASGGFPDETMAGRRMISMPSVALTLALAASRIFN